MFKNQTFLENLVYLHQEVEASTSQQKKEFDSRVETHYQWLESYLEQNKDKCTVAQTPSRSREELSRPSITPLKAFNYNPPERSILAAIDTNIETPKVKSLRSSKKMPAQPPAPTLRNGGMPAEPPAPSLRNSSHASAILSSQDENTISEIVKSMDTENSRRIRPKREFKRTAARKAALFLDDVTTSEETPSTQDNQIPSTQDNQIPSTQDTQNPIDTNADLQEISETKQNEVKTSEDANIPVDDCLIELKEDQVIVDNNTSNDTPLVEPVENLAKEDQIHIDQIDDQIHLDQVEEPKHEETQLDAIAEPSIATVDEMVVVEPLEEKVSSKPSAKLPSLDLSSIAKNSDALVEQPINKQPSSSEEEDQEGDQDVTKQAVDALTQASVAEMTSKRQVRAKKGRSKKVEAPLAPAPAQEEEEAVDFGAFDEAVFAAFSPRKNEEPEVEAPARKRGRPARSQTTQSDNTLDSKEVEPTNKRSTRSARAKATAAKALKSKKTRNDAESAETMDVVEIDEAPLTSNNDEETQEEVLKLNNRKRSHSELDVMSSDAVPEQTNEVVSETLTSAAAIEPSIDETSVPREEQHEEHDIISAPSPKRRCTEQFEELRDSAALIVNTPGESSSTGSPSSATTIQQDLMEPTEPKSEEENDVITTMEVDQVEEEIVDQTMLVEEAASETTVVENSSEVILSSDESKKEESLLSPVSDEIIEKESNSYHAEVEVSSPLPAIPYSAKVECRLNFEPIPSSSILTKNDFTSNLPSVSREQSAREVEDHSSSKRSSTILPKSESRTSTQPAPRSTSSSVYSLSSSRSGIAANKAAAAKELNEKVARTQANRAELEAKKKQEMEDKKSKKVQERLDNLRRRAAEMTASKPTASSIKDRTPNSLIGKINHVISSTEKEIASAEKEAALSQKSNEQVSSIARPSTPPSKGAASLPWPPPGISVPTTPPSSPGCNTSSVVSPPSLAQSSASKMKKATPRRFLPGLMKESFKTPAKAAPASVEKSVKTSSTKKGHGIWSVFSQFGFLSSKKEEPSNNAISESPLFVPTNTTAEPLNNRPVPSSPLESLQSNPNYLLHSSFTSPHARPVMSRINQVSSPVKPSETASSSIASSSITSSSIASSSASPATLTDSLLMPPPASPLVAASPRVDLFNTSSSVLSASSDDQMETCEDSSHIDDSPSKQTEKLLSSSSNLLGSSSLISSYSAGVRAVPSLDSDDDDDDDMMISAPQEYTMQQQQEDHHAAPLVKTPPRTHVVRHDSFLKSPEFQYPLEPVMNDSDDEEDFGVTLPSWTQKDSLYPFLEQQYQVDPDMIFGSELPSTCDLAEIFSECKNKVSARPRTSSAVWTKDKLTLEERREYKRRMGFINESISRSDRYITSQSSTTTTTTTTTSSKSKIPVPN